ncbi:MAG TPA: helicase-related protein [Candidatus Acidoferrales bacterium]|nr:helicase-related protein [Candidatus Acidoferrales bacterium]
MKRVVSAQKRIERVAAYEPKIVAGVARERHRPGTLTLVVVNQVERAREIFRQLGRTPDGADMVLLHSRFRENDRKCHLQSLLAEIDPSGPGRIVVSTQVVEAGVNVSASTLITDVAPWSSLVQRFGRCNRFGLDSGSMCLWLDGGEPKKNEAAPYEIEDIIAARRLLITMEGASVAPTDLPPANAIPLRSGLVIRKPELLDLFDTAPDFAGHNVDVSPYIREGDEMSVSVFWRDEPPNAKDRPVREELCAAPVSQIRELVRGLRAGGHGKDARCSNQFAKDADAAWTDLSEAEVRPGILVWLKSDVGWYDTTLGFGKNQRLVEPVPHEVTDDLGECCETIDSDILSGIGEAVTLARHSQDAKDMARILVEAVAFAEPAATVVTTAALWHDAGKAHQVFQETMQRANHGAVGVWAKGIDRYARHKRRGFLHELPGALAYLHAHGDDRWADAVAYLIAAHMGRVRVAAQQLPYEAGEEPFQILGCRDGDVVPATDLGGGVASPQFTLRLDPFRVGANDAEPSWIDRAIGLRDSETFGPFRLAYLELLVRLADWRASAEEKKCR